VILSEHTTNSIAPMSTASRMSAILQEAGGMKQRTRCLRTVAFQ